MKITNRQYAQGLFEATKGKGKGELQNELENFVKILVANGEMARLESILTEFEKVWQKENGIVAAEISSADRLEAETLAQIKGYVASETGAEDVLLEHSVDKSLLAGFILRFNDQILDGSAKNMVSNLKKELIK